MVACNDHLKYKTLKLTETFFYYYFSFIIIIIIIIISKHKTFM